MQRDKQTGWTHAASPFHRGEQAIQTRLGIRDKMENIGRRFIRSYMPEQHRTFYQQLPFLMVGSVDSQGRPWASLLTGEPGFITAPDEVTLHINARPLAGDPLNHNLQENVDLGLLGIELETRRRNRLNGKVKALNADGFAITVTQSFGNCPQYIQKRRLQWLPERLTSSPTAVQRFSQLTASLSGMIARADTLFIATRSGEAETSPNQGVDVSHRGGRPGFVKVEDATTMTFPDFAGNNFYNTLGNIVVDNRVGLLFIDFDAGHLLSITGQAEIIWAGAELQRFPGAQQLLRITTDKIVYLPAALPFRWEFEEYSPALEFTGQWQQAA